VFSKIEDRKRIAYRDMAKRRGILTSTGRQVEEARMCGRLRVCANSRNSARTSQSKDLDGISDRLREWTDTITSLIMYSIKANTTFKYKAYH
jgi:predicted Zn-dependent protease